MRHAACALAIAIAGCGGKPATTTPTQKTYTFGDPVPTKPLFELAKVADQGLVVFVSDAPTAAAFVAISATGAIEVTGPAATWLAASTAKWTPVPDVDSLRATVLDQAAGDPKPNDAADDDRPPPEEAERAEGQYKMRREDPAQAREQAIRQAREAGILASPTSNTLDGRPSSAEPGELRVLSELTPVVFAPPKAPAVVLARVATRAGAMLAVTHDGVPKVLRIGFHRAATNAGAPRNLPWTELHVEPAGLVLVRFPKAELATIPWKGDAVDRDALRAKLRADEREIDVLVRGDVTTQRLLDVIAALDGRKAWIGESPGAPADRAKQVAAAKQRRHAVTGGTIASQGDLDKAVIRQTVQAQIDRIRSCYEKALLGKPALQGTVNVQFLIEPSGAVRSAAASGVDPHVATCIAAEVKKLVFPKPKGGGMVQVNYPFQLQPMN